MSSRRLARRARPTALIDLSWLGPSAARRCAASWPKLALLSAPADTGGVTPSRPAPALPTTVPWPVARSGPSVVAATTPWPDPTAASPVACSTPPLRPRLGRPHRATTVWHSGHQRDQTKTPLLLVLRAHAKSHHTRVQRRRRAPILTGSTMLSIWKILTCEPGAVPDQTPIKTRPAIILSLEP
jgi:hypothetical protein